MSDLDTDVSSMMTDFLEVAGDSFVYLRGSTSTTITLRKSVQLSVVIDNGNGHVLTVKPVDFIGLTSALPYDPPLKGDQIVGGGMTFEVQPTVSEDVYRRITATQTRVHTKRIK